jgi:hypothetical protein
MRKKVESFFDHLKTYISYYIAITTAIGILWSCFIVYRNWVDNNKNLQNNVENITNGQIKLQTADSLLLQNQIEIKKEIDNLKEGIENNTEKLNSLEKSYIRYISNDEALTKSDFLKYMDGLTIDSKKKLTTSLSTTK